MAADPNQARELGEKSPANRWVLIAFCLYVLLILFCQLIFIGSETHQGYYRQVSFSLAHISWRSVCGSLISALIFLLPAFVPVIVFIRSVKLSIRRGCTAFALLLFLIVMVFYGNPFALLFGIFSLPFQIASLLKAACTPALHTREWWNETAGICIIYGLGLWSLSWLAVPFLGTGRKTPVEQA